MFAVRDGRAAARSSPSPRDLFADPTINQRAPSHCDPRDCSHNTLWRPARLPARRINRPLAPLNASTQRVQRQSTRAVSGRAVSLVAGLMDRFGLRIIITQLRSPQATFEPLAPRGAYKSTRSTLSHSTRATFGRASHLAPSERAPIAARINQTRRRLHRRRHCRRRPPPSSQRDVSPEIGRREMISSAVAGGSREARESSRQLA